MGLADYLDEPDETQFVAGCLWCGRPVRTGEYRRRDDGAACLDCDAALDGDLARVEGET